MNDRCDVELGPSAWTLVSGATFPSYTRSDNFLLCKYMY